MFSDFLKKFTGQGAEEAIADEEDARLALASLLVRIARSNWDYSDVETAQIDVILTDTVQFTRAIKAAVPLDERDAVVEALWELVLADGVRDHEEEGVLRLVAPLLGINDRDSALARQRVEARMATG